MIQTIYFYGDRNELMKVQQMLDNKGFETVGFQPAQMESGWLEETKQIVFALLGSSAIASLIAEYIKSNKIDIEYSNNDDKVKISCNKGSKDDVEAMLKRIIEITNDKKKENKDNNGVT